MEKEWDGVPQYCTNRILFVQNSRFHRGKAGFRIKFPVSGHFLHCIKIFITTFAAENKIT